VETARLETFSDGVFAIAATLLILDVRVSGAPLGHALLHAWPQYAAYALSFVTIGILWINHHTVFQQIDRVDRTFLMLNVVFLMVIAFVPFPTRLVAEHLGHEGARAAALLYGLTFTSLAIMYSAIWFYAALGRRLIAENADQRTISGISRSYLPGAPIYAVATLAAFLSPYLSVALYAAIAVFYVLESSIFGRDEPPAY
jgi:TMEM175 potassium channel family protein